MAVITPPAASADSYISLADANAYFAARLNSGSWTAAVDGDKEAALIQATRLLDAEDWIGNKADELAANALRWPRSEVVNADGQAVASDSVPVAIQYATAELAIELLTAASSSATAAAAAAPTTELSVGSISLKFGDVDTSSGTAAYSPQFSSFVESLIAPYRNAGGSATSLTRA